MNNRDKVLAFLTAREACSRSLEWAREASEDFNFEKAWTTCPRGDWLAWIMAELTEPCAALAEPPLDPKWGTIAACVAAECALHHIPAGQWHTAARALLDKVKAWALADEQTEIHVSKDATKLYEEVHSVGGRYSDRDYALLAVAYAAWTVGYVHGELTQCVDNAIDASDPNAADEGVRIQRNKDIADAIRKAVPWRVMGAAIHAYGYETGLLDQGHTNGQGVEKV